MKRQLATAKAARRGFVNWKRLMALVFLSKYAGVRTAEFTAVTRDGIRMSSPGWEGPLWPIIEMFATDDYRLKGYSLNAPRILDIGAHIGSFTVAACHVFEGARCTSYEPAPDTFTYLKRNVVNNGLEHQVRLMPCAVTGTGASVTLTGRGIGDSTNRVVRADEHAGDISAPGTTLREALRSIDGPIDICKIDCEGAEYDIVESVDESDWSQVRALILEYHPWPERDWSWLEERLQRGGFRVEARTGDMNGGIAWLSNR
jgi:FkbM family methyltransferase